MASQVLSLLVCWQHTYVFQSINPRQKREEFSGGSLSDSAVRLSLRGKPKDIYKVLSNRVVSQDLVVLVYNLSMVSPGDGQ